MAKLKTRSELRFILNGRDVALSDVAPDQTLLDWLRLSRSLKGSKRASSLIGRLRCGVSGRRGYDA